MNSTSRMVLAIIGAAAAGAVIGMLVAPEKGSDLRRRISETAGDWSSQLNQLLASGKEQLQNLADSAKSTAENMTDEDSMNRVRERM